MRPVARDTKGEPVLPVRIYALAKELKVDSKDLVDICAKAGITGKGSALASLTDDESDKVKAFVAGGGPLVICCAVQVDRLRKTEGGSRHRRRTPGRDGHTSS